MVSVDSCERAAAHQLRTTVSCQTPFSSNFYYLQSLFFLTLRHGLYTVPGGQGKWERIGVAAETFFSSFHRGKGTLESSKYAKKKSMCGEIKISHLNMLW